MSTSLPVESAPAPAMSQPVPAGAATTGQAPAETAATRRTYLQTLNAAEQHWKWKAGLRVLICILCIIGIGAAGYLVNVGRVPDDDYGFGFGPSIINAWALIPLGISFIFCMVCLLVLLLRRPPRPAHPGIAVGMDLVLWLGFLTVALLTLAFAVFSLISYADVGDSYGDMYSSSYTGHYDRAPNGTYVYHLTSTPDRYYNYTTGTYTTVPNASPIERDCTPEFSSCAEQDKAVNNALRKRRSLYHVAVLLDTVLFLCVLLHFVLFVWACVDTSRYRSGSNRQAFEAAVRKALDEHARDQQAGQPMPVAQA